MSKRETAEVLTAEAALNAVLADTLEVVVVKDGEPIHAALAPGAANAIAARIAGQMAYGITPAMFHAKLLRLGIKDARATALVNALEGNQSIKPAEEQLADRDAADHATSFLAYLPLSAPAPTVEAIVVRAAVEAASAAKSELTGNPRPVLELPTFTPPTRKETRGDGLEVELPEDPALITEALDAHNALVAQTVLEHQAAERAWSAANPASDGASLPWTGEHPPDLRAAAAPAQQPAAGAFQTPEPPHWKADPEASAAENLASLNAHQQAMKQWRDFNGIADPHALNVYEAEIASRRAPAPLAGESAMEAARALQTQGAGAGLVAEDGYPFGLTEDVSGPDDA
jgi:hypothetical protein